MAEVTLAKMQVLARNNSIQITKTYVDLPTEKNRGKLAPLLNVQGFVTKSVIKLKTKLPIIPILDMDKFSTKERFVGKDKKQNSVINELIKRGSEFSIVYSKNIGEGQGEGQK